MHRLDWWSECEAGIHYQNCFSNYRSQLMEPNEHRRPFWSMYEQKLTAMEERRRADGWESGNQWDCTHLVNLFRVPIFTGKHFNLIDCSFNHLLTCRRKVCLKYWLRQCRCRSQFNVSVRSESSDGRFLMASLTWKKKKVMECSKSSSQIETKRSSKHRANLWDLIKSPSN